MGENAMSFGRASTLSHLITVVLCFPKKWRLFSLVDPWYTELWRILKRCYTA